MKKFLALTAFSSALVLAGSFAQAGTMRAQRCVKQRGAKTVICAEKVAPAAAAPYEKCDYIFESGATVCTRIGPVPTNPNVIPAVRENCHFDYESAATFCEYNVPGAKRARKQPSRVQAFPYGNQPEQNCHKNWETGMTECE